ncbi:MAG: signal peptide peptidase SppA [Clostridiales Family XIII bacterium]|jgi:protease-4|nr:signal peptide peptidase SppA [Clostridiales Family XIII bacterium]
MDNYNYQNNDVHYNASGGASVSIPPTPYKKQSGGKTAILVISIIVGVLVLMAIAGSLFRNWLSTSTPTVSRPAEDYLARLYVVGEIAATDDPYTSSAETYHHSFTIQSIDELMSDENNKGLLLYVDTPGGTVYESDALYLKLEQYKEETGRPVYVYMGSMAASGGYYVSAGAEKIYANRNTWTGSIGVIIGTLFDVSEFLENYGIKTTDITSGANKNMGSYYESMTEEQRQIFQSLVDESYDQFVGIVAEGRGMTDAEVREIADGRIYTAKQAVANGLIDEIASQEEALSEILDALGNTNMRVYDMEFAPTEVGIFDLLMKTEVPSPKGSSNGNMPSDVAAILELMRQDGDVPIKYMYVG